MQYLLAEAESSPVLSGTTKTILQIYATYPVIGVLLLLMLLDVISGIIAAFAMRELNSNTSWNGMCKKALMIIIVGVASVLDPYAQGLPIAKLVSFFYVITEALSVIENAARAGVPIPRVLLDALSKLKSDERTQQQPITINKIEVKANVDAHQEHHDSPPQKTPPPQQETKK